MNYLTSNLTTRLSRNDPSLTAVSMRKMPCIEISSDETTAIVKALQNNIHVETVEISDLVDHEGLFETLQSNTSISSFTASQVSSNEAWKALCRGLQQNKTITELSLGSDTQLEPIELSIAACEAIRDLLATSKTIEKLSLQSFCINEGMAALVAGFAANKSLHELRIQQIGSEHLNLLIESLGNIERLSIVDCDLDFNGIDNTDHFLTRLVSSSDMTELRLTECYLGNEEISAVSEGIKSSDSIKLLDLTGNNLLASSCKPLADMLAVNTSLCFLILDENFIGDVGVELLSHGLARNEQLYKLDLKANHIGADGCERLASGLTKASSSVLQLLDLSDNDIADAGATALGELLKTNHHLRCLTLDACMISDEGITKLCSGLSTNTTLQELTISNNCCKRCRSQSCIRHAHR